MPENVEGVIIVTAMYYGRTMAALCPNKFKIWVSVEYVCQY